MTMAAHPGLKNSEACIPDLDRTAIYDPGNYSGIRAMIPSFFECQVSVVDKKYFLGLLASSRNPSGAVVIHRECYYYKCSSLHFIVVPLPLLRWSYFTRLVDSLLLEDQTWKLVLVVLSWNCSGQQEEYA
jgi:hypothetical protein